MKCLFFPFLLHAFILSFIFQSAFYLSETLSESSLSCPEFACPRLSVILNYSLSLCIALKPDIFEAPQEVVEMRPKTRSGSQSSNRENRPSATISKLQPVLPPHCPKPKIKAVAPPVLPPGDCPCFWVTCFSIMRRNRNLGMLDLEA